MLEVRVSRRTVSGLHCAVFALAAAAFGYAPIAAAEREVLPGITTDRVVLGKPYDLLGNRIVFTNWYYIDPGDLDWRDDAGTSVYVHGDEPADTSQFVGIRPPRGIKIAARKAEVVGPFDNMPYRSILQEDDTYKGWTSSEYFE